MQYVEIASATQELGLARAMMRHSRAKRRAETLYRCISATIALFLLVILATIALILVSTAWPAITKYGSSLLTGTTWDPGRNIFGAWPFIAGTLITTSLALVIAVPFAIAIALLVTEFAPAWLAAMVGVIIDVAAGVPTIVFGAWSLLALIPWLRDTAEPAIQWFLGWIPLFSTPPIGYLTGQGMFAAGLVLATMVFPTIVAITRNSFLATSLELREASLGLGATRWETATRVVMRQGRPGLFGAVILACGRSLGEAIAVIYVIGSATQVPASLFDVGNTLSAHLLTQVGGAIPGSLNTASLYELGVLLLILSLSTSLVGRLSTRRLAGLAAITGGGR